MRIAEFGTRNAESQTESMVAEDDSSLRTPNSAFRNVLCVVPRRLEEGEQRKGGIIIPDSAKEKPQQAEVIAVGNGKLLDSGDRVAIEVKAGDRILFGKYSGSDIKMDGEEFLILKEDEILDLVAYVLSRGDRMHEMFRR